MKRTTIFQGIKFILVGVLATFCDLGIFDLLVWVLMASPLIAKTISFLFSTAIKYGGNKYWTFQKHEKDQMYKEIFVFFIITLVALVIDLAAFYYATKMLGSQFGVSVKIWTQLSVIFAALSSAVVSFLGYKFLVFKK